MFIPSGLIITEIGSAISSTVNMKIPVSHLSRLRRICYSGLADMKLTLNNFQVQGHKNSILFYFFTLHRILADRKRNYFYTKYDRIARYDHREAVAATTVYTIFDITNSRQ